MHQSHNSKESVSKTLESSNVEEQTRPVYGVLLHGFLKTRYIDISDHDKKSIFNVASSWKLRYWTLQLTDDGLTLEKSRRADAKSYKGFFLPFGKTSVWENWGKRGDKYCFGFTIRVSSTTMQIEAAADSENTRNRWMNVLRRSFTDDTQDSKQLVQTLNQKVSCKLSRNTDAADEQSDDYLYSPDSQPAVSLLHAETSGSWNNDAKPVLPKPLASPNNLSNDNAAIETEQASICTDTYRCSRTRAVLDEFDCKSLDGLVRDDNTIPRRYHAELYDPDGCMSENLERKRCFESDSLPDIIDEPETEVEKRKKRNKRRDTQPTTPNNSNPVQSKKQE